MYLFGFGARSIVPSLWQRAGCRSFQSRAGPSEANARNGQTTYTQHDPFALALCLLGTIIRNLFNRWWIFRIRVDFTNSTEQLYDIHNNFSIPLCRNILESGASVNIYMFFGGTNFGFTAGEFTNSDLYLFIDLSIGHFPGANDWGTGKYMADITSYDYDAVMTEAGDPNGPKYTKVKEVIEQHFKLPVGAVPATKRKMTLPSVELYAKTKLLSADGRKFLGTNGRRSSANPLSFEQLRQYSGLVLYEATLPKIEINPTLLTVNELHDRAYVLLDDSLVGILSRENNISSLPINGARGQKLQILVENQGRINFDVFDDFKVLLVVVQRQSDEINWDFFCFRVFWAMSPFRHSTGHSRKWSIGL